MSTYTDLIDDIKPQLSDESVIASVLAKNQIVKRKRIRNISVSVFVLTVFATMTLTVGAVNDWNYASLIQRIFNNNQIVADSIDNETSYRVTNNTYEGFTFELSGLYADEESLLLIVEITSDKPVFNESYAARGSLFSTLVMISNSTGLEIAYTANFTVNDFQFYVINENRIILVNVFAEPKNPVEFTYDEHTSNVFQYNKAVLEGKEFTLLFGDASHSDIFSKSFNGLPLKGGGAEVRFTIDAFNDQNVIMFYPDISFGINEVVKEIRLTPFSIIVRFEGIANSLDSEYVENYGWMTKIAILMNDGNLIPLEMMNNEGGLLRHISYGYHANYENHSWIASFHHDKLLDLNEVQAVVLDGIEINVN